MYLTTCPNELAVVPILIGPLQVLLALLPGIAVAVAGLLLAMFKPSTVKHLLQLLWSQKLAVAAVALVIWLTSTVMQHIPSAGGSDVSGAGATGGDWAMLLGGNDRRGFAAGSEEPTAGGVNWTFTPDGIKAFYATPAVSGKRLYITSAQYGVFTDQGGIHCVDAESGREIWRFDSSGYRSTFSSPVVADKYLVVGEGLHLTNDARVFCLDIEASNQAGRGVKLWEYRTNSHVESSPCVADGRVLIGAGSDGFYCFALEGDGQDGAKVLWHLSGEAYPDCETSPAVYDGKVYFGLGVGGNGAVCADAATGEIAWRIDTPYPVLGSPAIAGGKVYLGMGHGDYVNTAEQVAGNLRSKMTAEGRSETEITEATKSIVPSGELWCIDAKTGAIDWRFKVERTILAAPAISDGRIYFGSRDGHLYCVDTFGKLIEKWQTGSAVITSPAVGDQFVYVMTEAGQLYGLDKDNLRPRWDVPVGSASFSSPVVANGQVYVGTNEKGLLSLGQAGENEIAAIWRGDLGSDEYHSGGDGSAISMHGAYAWGLLPVPGHEKDKVTGVTIEGPPAYLDGVIYAGVNHESGSGLAAMEVADGPGSKPTVKWFAESDLPVVQSAAVTESAALFVDGRPGDSGRMLRCVDVQTGLTTWTKPVDAKAGGQLVISGHQVFVADTTDEIACFNIVQKEGSQAIWREKVGSVTGRPMVAGDMLFVSIEQPGEVLAIDMMAGLVVWRQGLAAKPRTGPLVIEHRVWVGHDDGISDLGLTDTAEDLAISGVQVDSELVSNGKYLAFCGDGEMNLVDVESGEVIASQPDAIDIYPPMFGDGGVLYYAEGSIQRYNWAKNERNLWAAMRATWPGRPTSAMIMVDSHAIFATDRRSLVCMKPKTR